MNAILILLGMFSLTFFVANLDFLKKVNAFSFISIPILIGLFFSPTQGLVPILPSTLSELSWALKVGLTWIAFLVGARLWKVQPSLESVIKLLPFFLGHLVFFFSTLIIIHTFEFSDLDMFSLAPSSIKLLATSLILSSVLFSSKENPFVLFFFFISLLYLFTNNLYKFTYLNLLIPVAIGFLMGLVCRLIIPADKSLNTPGRLTLAGVCILGTGWSAGLGDLEVLVGLGFGWSMATLHNVRVLNDTTLTKTLIPLKFVIALFCGMFITITPSVMIIGVLLALTRFAMKALILNFGLRKASIEEVLTTIIPISQLALPITLSLHLSKFHNEDTGFILSSFCVGFIANDILSLILEFAKRDALNANTKEEVAS
ncbi:MAG: hypothetical protein M9899_07890 [Bdellovibrionaceae bacterium]|nr:hypothetical protein [Pseudobdellovibrionaceae bacterium]